MSKKVKLRKAIEQEDKGKVKQTKITYTRPDEKFLIGAKDTKQLVKEVFEKTSKQSDNFKIFVRILSPKQRYSFNVDDMGDIINYKEHEEYFEGTVKQVSKLVMSSQVEIYVQTFD